MHDYNGFINLYKPRGITSAQMVGVVKRLLGKPKIGHTGTLDPEAEGILPLAIGEATKLSQILTDGKKKYRFKIQFGAKTSTGDIEGEIISRTDKIPLEAECYNIVGSFIGEITQTPHAFSAIKIGGKRAYDLARAKKDFTIPPRKITIYDLKCLSFDKENSTAIYEAECSKGTYIRTLAEDISLSLQSLGFVLELVRTKVASFIEENSINFQNLMLLSSEDAKMHLVKNISRIDSVLDDIPVLDINNDTAYKVRCGQEVLISSKDMNLLWLRYENNLLAIGSLHQGRFNSSRVFNL